MGSIHDFLRTLYNRKFSPCPLNQNRTIVGIISAQVLLCAMNCHTFYLIEHPKQYRASLVVQLVNSRLAMQETRVQSLHRDFLEKANDNHSNNLAWKFHK